MIPATPRNVRLMQAILDAVRDHEKESADEA